MNGHLDANLSALRERCPDFLAWWEKCPSQPGEYNLLSSLSGLPDLEIVRPGGQRIILYNRENPFETIQKELADQTFPKGSLTFLFGLGLGYRALHILSVMEPGHTVYIVERDPDILRLALSLHDYSAEIRKGNIVFVVPEEEELRRIVEEKSGAILTGRIRLFTEKYIRMLEPRTANLHDICHNQCNAILLNFRTVIHIGETVIQNEVENLPKALLGWTPESLLNGAFRNRPAIIVATGPSLQKNISLLQKAKGKALIIAVAQALRVLLAYDIRPDIICSVDFGEPNYRAMADAIAEADMPLLMHPQVFPRIPYEYQGDLFVTQDRHSLLAPPVDHDRSSLGYGLTVAQIALNLALAMGADPIVFTGQDLAYGESSHVDGAVDGNRVTIRGSHIVMKNEWGTREQDVYWVPGYFGGRVPTSSGLLAFLEHFEETVRHHTDRRFINATEGGAHISGTERMPLRDVLDAYCQKEFPIAELLSAVRTPIGADPHRLCRMLEASRSHLDRILRHAEKLSRMINEMKDLLPGNDEKMSHHQMNQLQSLNRKALKEFSSLLKSLDEEQFSRLATVRVKQLLIRMQEQPEQSGEIRGSFERTIQYCEELCEGLRAACPPLLEKIDRVHPLLNEYANVSDDLQAASPDTNQEAELRLRLGTCLRRMGHLAKAAEELEQAARSESFRVEALKTLFVLYLDRNRFKDAMECLEQLPEGHPEKNSLQNCLKERMNRDQERLLERARFCLDQEEFVGCLLACRALAARHRGNSADVRHMMDRSLEMRERKIRSAQQQVQEERAKGSLQENRDHRLQTARLKMEQKDYSVALALFQELVDSDPKDEEAGLGKVLAHERMQNWEGAEGELHHLIQHHPPNGIYFRELGNVLLRRGKSGEALNCFKKAVDLDTGNGELSLHIAAALFGAGKAADSLPFYERHMKDNPNDYRALVMWGDGFLRLGIGAAAKLSWETALRIRPGYGPAVERLKQLQPAANS